MDWIRLQQQAFSAYNYVSELVYDNPVVADSIVIGAVIGSVVWLRKAAIRRRLRRARHRWGAQMQRSRNRLAYEKAELAFAIEDKLFDMVHAGDMTEKSAQEWRNSFANYYQMDELRPSKDQKSVKKSIKRRLVTLVHKWKPMMLGTHPAKDLKIDQTYKPVFEAEGSSKSKYLKVARC